MSVQKTEAILSGHGLWYLPRPSLNQFADSFTRHRAMLGLVALALLTRIPLLSMSLDEVDAANFFNALNDGYNIPLMRPHPPGYPVYVFIGWVFDSVLNSPLLSLTLVSALLGSFAVAPFYLLLREFTGPKMALVGSLLFIVNPLVWSYSETALSDVPSMFFVLMVAWLSYRGRHNTKAFLWACVVASLAIGVRQPNIALLPFLLFPLGYRLVVMKKMSWRMSATGVAIFFVTTLLWSVPMVYLGSGGIESYLDAAMRQWSDAVHVYDITNVESPWFVNVLFRMERFSFGYFLTYAWTGDDAKTRLTLLLAIPWLLGFALFVTGFSFKNSRHIFTAFWVISIVYVASIIHFLPRYGLAQLPGYIIACFIGYQFLWSKLLSHPRGIEILSVLGIGCSLVLYGIKYQSPVSTFEVSPPDGSFYAGATLTIGILIIFLARYIYRHTDSETRQPATDKPTSGISIFRRYPILPTVAVAMFIASLTINGYSLSSIAHSKPNPGQELVEYVRANFDATSITPCWDHQTHSSFEALMPGIVPLGFWSVNELFDAYNSGKILILTDQCLRFDEIDAAFELSEVAFFRGESPVWSKTPTMRLYVTGER